MPLERGRGFWRFIRDQSVRRCIISSLIFLYAFPIGHNGRIIIVLLPVISMTTFDFISVLV